MKNRDQKNHMSKRLSVLLLCAVMLMGLLTISAGAAQNVTYVTAKLSPHFNIVVDGTDQTFYNAQGQEVHPIAYNGTTYLPLRAIGELMNKNVNWDQSTLTVTLSGTRSAEKVTGTPDNSAKQKSISAQIRPDFTVVVDDVTLSFTSSDGGPVYPLLYNGGIYLPLKSIGELMGSAVGWDADTNTVTLTSPSSLVTDADSFDQVSGTATKPAQTTQATKPAQSAQAAQASTNSAVITAEAARSKALSHAGLTAGQVTFTKTKLDREDGRQVYDVEFYYGTAEYDYEIDAATGAVVSYDYDAGRQAAAPSGSGAMITVETAKGKALSNAGLTAGQVTFTGAKLDREDGRQVYDVEFRYESTEYEYEIDAYTGAVLSKKVDSTSR